MTNDISKLNRDDVRKAQIFRKLRAAASSLNAVEQHVRSPRSVVVREGTALFGAYSLRLTQRELAKTTTKSETEGRAHFVEVIMYVRQPGPDDDGSLGLVGFTFADAADAKSFVHYVFGRDIAEGEVADREVRMLVVASSDADDEFSVDVVEAPEERTLVAPACDAGVVIDAVPPSVRRVAALFGCSVGAAAYIDALETRVAALEQKVSELRHDVRKVRRAA